MDGTTSAQGLATSPSSLVLQHALAGLLGLFIIGFVGFAHLDAVHNAGHDYRHSMAFPCH